jgi:flagellar biosynthesis/type III secretory pathway M-ring protein FliF/YscJ
LVFLLCAVVLVWRTRRKAQVKDKELQQARQVIRELEQSPTRQALQASEAPQLQAPADEQVRALALELAAKDPASAAMVLKKWLGQSSGTAAAA